MNNYLPLLIKLTESDKRIIFFILGLVILVFVLLGIIGSLIVRIMKWQGKKMGTMVHDVLVYYVVKDKKHLLSYGTKKNCRLFFKQSKIACLILIIGAIFLVVRGIVTKDFSYNPFNFENGFGTLLFSWDFENAPRTMYFGREIISGWPELNNVPHFVLEAWWSYIIVPCFIVGGIWYLITVQALIARRIKLFKIAGSVFEKSVDDFHQDGTNNPNPNTPSPTSY